MALAHRWTEARLAEAPFGVTILRNGLYSQLAAGMALTAAKDALQTGVLALPWGDGRLATVAREDLAEVAARVAAESDADLRAGHRGRHAGRTYELEGLTALSGDDLAALLAEVSGRPVRYESAPLWAVRSGLEAAGLPALQITHAISTLANIGAGFLGLHPSDLPHLLPAAPRQGADTVRALVRAELG
ncbi:nucleoside-diphosphate-sugar epimerase [Parafrankia sp. EAN1pec]|uniref:nucleoside-diphosphate sugar epimerase n=1 Tax=Parafrankia sp. (strain EAN1pec) TaxID=298653 RepID=UPI0000543CAC|nr:nucleoside-diphosphate-sugar epimerase [Frankia sp. EAN1pec]